MSEAIAAEKNYKCMSAIGHVGFCDCLKTNLPIKITFENYISIATTPSTDVDLAALSKDDRPVYETTMKARDVCVAQAFPRR
jgi:hypothetical protein